MKEVHKRLQEIGILYDDARWVNMRLKSLSDKPEFLMAHIPLNDGEPTLHFEFPKSEVEQRLKEEKARIEAGIQDARNDAIKEMQRLIEEWK